MKLNLKMNLRLDFSDDEKRLKWLPLLLDAYAVIDEGIAVAIKAEEEKQNTGLACKNGCANCCRTHRDIPVYPLELTGIYWYCIEKISEPLRVLLKKQLSEYEIGSTCPFLSDGSCIIHPMRPVSCRQFNVFNAPCAEGEDPYYTRREDVLTPIEDYTNKAFYIMLPFYGVENENDKLHVLKNSLIHTQVRVLQSCNWKELAKRMDEFDLKEKNI